MQAKEFEFFRIETIERFKEGNKMFLYIAKGGLQINHFENKMFYSNIMPLEIEVNTDTFKVVNKLKNIVFSTGAMSNIFTVDSISDFNRIKGFKAFLKREAEREQKWSNGSNSLNVSLDTKKILLEIEEMCKNTLIDKSLKENDKDLFDKLTG